MGFECLKKVVRSSHAPAEGDSLPKWPAVTDLQLLATERSRKMRILTRAGQEGTKARRRITRQLDMTMD